MIELKNATKKFGQNVIFENKNIEFEDGKAYGIIGENGLGKTVLLKTICGYSVLTSGDVLQDGKKIREKLNFLEDAGIVIEKPEFMNDYTLYENLEIIKKFSDKKEEVNLDFWIEFYNISKYSNVKYKHLSLGTKQKMLLIQAFMTKPKVLILDECLSGLDDESSIKTIEYIKSCKENGVLILITSHIKSDLEEICDEIIVL